MTSSKGFQHHFNIISKFVCCGCYMKKNAAFALISFAVLKWHECLSFQLLFELTVEIPVQLHLELEVNLLVRNVIEREIEKEKVQMKPPRITKSLEFWEFSSLLKLDHNYGTFFKSMRFNILKRPWGRFIYIIDSSNSSSFTFWTSQLTSISRCCLLYTSDAADE